MTNLSFTTLFLNAFGVSPEQAGVTVSEGAGTLNGHTIRLSEEANRLTGWTVDGQPFMEFRMFARNDPRTSVNLDNLKKAAAQASSQANP